MQPARRARAPSCRHAHGDARAPVPRPRRDADPSGRAFTLPANPLSELDATDLASFIDSTLLESDDEDATLERVAGRRP